jgi:hypothetical protein
MERAQNFSQDSPAASQRERRQDRPRCCRMSALLLLVYVLAGVSCQAQRVHADETWEAVQNLLSGIHGVSTSPPGNLISGKYTSGALMGNGDIGVVAGDSSTSRQSFYFGKSDFWGAGAHYEGLPEAGEARHNAPECNWACRVSILSLGVMTISSPASGSDADRVYRVDQDILHARVETTFKAGPSTIHLRSWTADGENTFVTEVTADSKDQADLPMQLIFTMPNPQAPGGIDFPVSTGSRDGVLWATRENSGSGAQDYKARAAIAIRLLGAGLAHAASTPSSTSADFTLKSGRPVWIVVVFESDARIGLRGTTAAALAQAAVDRAGSFRRQRIETLEQAHLAWWKKFWLRSFVQVHDKVLEEYYYGALYVLGCATRPGTLAPSLFANFITTENVAWGGLYFMNYNEEAPFYGVFSSNHAELAKPYIQMVSAQMAWQRNLTARAGYQGVSYQRTFSPFTVVAAPPPLAPVAANKDYKRLPSDQKSNATFSWLPAIQYYEYTQDREFLRTLLYPAMKQLDLFWRDFAMRNSSGKGWIFVHSAAHEGGDDVNPNLDLGFARRVARELIATSEVLGVDAPMRPVWRSFLNQLSPYPTGTVNGKSVYYIAAAVKNKSEYHGLFEPGDQPINLEGIVFPGENLSVGGDPEELETARNSMLEMNSWGVTEGGNTENGFCKIFPIAARIGWPAEDLVAKFRAAILHQWRPSNLTVFQDGGGIETSGSIEALDSMLLQHEDGVLRVFPDWPRSMDASFTRLRAKGAFLVSSAQSGGAVTSIGVLSEQGGPLTIQSPWGDRRVHSSGSSSVQPNGRGEITLITKRGGYYRLTPR